MRLETINNGILRTDVEGCSKAPIARAASAGGIATELSYGGAVSVAAESNGKVTSEVIYEPSAYPYLHVLPEHTVWVDVFMSADYDVFSNTNWFIN